MKKLMTLVLAASFILGSVCTSAAVEITASGSFDFMWGWIVNQDGFASNQDRKAAPGLGNSGSGLYNGAGNGTDDQFRAWQRERLQVNFIASENVQGVLYFEIGETAWGNPGSGGQIGTDAIAVEVRRAYIDFNVPNTELLFRVGLQGFALPAAVVGNPIIGSGGTDMGGIVSTYTVNDMVTIGAFWARPWDTNAMRGGRGEAASVNDEFDVFGLYVPITIDGVMTLTPYAMYGIAGTDAYYNLATPVWNNPGRFFGLATNASGGPYTLLGPDPNPYTDNDYQYMWWAGAAFEFTMLDPLTFGLDVVWGTSIDPSQDYLTRWGWYLAGRVDYQTPYVTPGLVAWWSTGDDENMWNGSERLPHIDGTFQATTFGFDGQALIGSAGDALGQSAEGTWGLALQFNDISFIEDLTHQLIVAYIGGTNHTKSMQDNRFATRGNPWFRNNGIALTTADYAWEIDFNHRYQIYENLAAVVEMSVLDIQRQAYPWRNSRNRASDAVQYNNGVYQLWQTSTAWKLAMGLQYRF